MNKRNFDINMDRKHFNVNTRDDKTFDKHHINYENNLDDHYVNMDREYFNISTNDKYHFIDKNRSLSERNFKNFLTQNDIRNRHTNISHDNRIISNNTRNNKKILNSDDNTFVNRTVNTNPYVSNQINYNRLKTIDTKQKNSVNFKKSNPDKFNPFLNYGFASKSAC